MADLTVINALRHFFPGKTALNAAYKEAWEAYSARQTSVTITSGRFEGGNSSGEIAGDPKEIMEACQFLLDEIDAGERKEVQASGPYHADFSTRILRT